MPQSPSNYPPQSPSRPQSSYYDPTREATTQNRSATEKAPPPTPYTNGLPADQRSGHSRPPSQSSPTGPSHAHPPPHADARSPPAYDQPGRNSRAHSHSTSTDNPPRSSNPMSMMNLLSDSGPPPPTPSARPPISPERKSSKSTSRMGSRASSASQQIRPRVKQEPAESRRDTVEKVPQAPAHSSHPPQSAGRPPLPPQTGPPGLTIRDTEAAYKEIESGDLSDVEADVPGMEVPKQEWLQRSHKRTLELEITETMKRKRRRLHLMQKYYDHFNIAAEADRAAFLDAHENEVAEEVRQREIEEDKERKKDQQRKRRREKAIADEQVKREEALQSLATVQDDEERTRLEKDIARFDKKIRDTQQRLQGITPVKESRNESPHTAALGKREKEVPMDQGLMTSFSVSNGQGHPAEEGVPEHTTSTRGRGRGGRGGGGGAGRARKSKEQKQAEKERAANAQMFVEAGQDLPLIAPKEEERLQGLDQTRDASEPMSDATPTTFEVQQPSGLSGLTGMAKFESKGYNQIYEQISRDIAKAIPKVVRIKNNSLDTKQSNAR
ncbi:hypothetical protein KC352_g31784, partial [Hortaea werneckii]